MAGLLPVMGSGSFAINNTKNKEIPMLKEYAYDFEKDDYFLDSNGNYIVVEGLEALQVRNYLNLKTYKNRYFIFGDEGSKLKNLVNKSYDYVQLHAQEYLEDALIDGVYNTGLEDFEVSMSENKSRISCKVISIYGTYELSEEV